jgi:polar amino acid transport system substrate-binding protein
MPGPDGELVGFDVDLVRGLAERLGVGLRLIPLVGGARLAAVRSGRVHVVAATLTRTPGREALVDFSLTYFRDAQRLLVRRETDIQGVESLDGLRVGVARGSTSEETLRRRVPAAQAVLFTNSREALPALLSGRLDAILSDGAILAGLRSLLARPHRLEIVGEPLSDEPYALALPTSDSPWRREVNAYLLDLWESGRWREMADRWFGSELPQPALFDLTRQDEPRP